MGPSSKRRGASQERSQACRDWRHQEHSCEQFFSYWSGQLLSIIIAQPGEKALDNALQCNGYIIFSSHVGVFVFEYFFVRLNILCQVGKISDVAANVSIGYQPEVKFVAIWSNIKQIKQRWSMKKYNGQSSNFVYKRTVNIVLIDVLASSSGVGERHDLQRPGRLQQAAAVWAQRNAEGGQGGHQLLYMVER